MNWLEMNIRFICLFFLSMRSAITTTQPTVTLKDGTVLQGIKEEFHSDLLPVHGEFGSFYGIPYAEPPIGALRFKPPLPRKQLESPFNAVKVGRSCMQPDPETHGVRLRNEERCEDCLFLDVIVPTHTPEKAHVFVMIHGGGFTIGAGQMAMVHFLTFAAYSNVIVVTFNYRLGPFGFLTTGDELIPGNLGLLDQQLALKWVNKNIAAFGGDPNKVTIAGFSAGSASVGFHTLSPGSKGLFQNAIMQSGSPIDSWVPNRQGKEAKLEVRTLAKLIGCSPEDIEDDSKLLSCLMEASADSILQNIGKVGQELGDPLFPVPGPNVDGVFLPKNASTIVEEENLNGENYIVGTNGDEGTLYLFLFFQDKEVTPVINSTLLPSILGTFIREVPDPIVVELIKTLYIVDPKDLVDGKRDDFFHEAAQYLADWFLMCSASKYARLTSATKNVYRYTMTFVPTNELLDIKWAGAGHGDEAQYVFGGVFQEKLLDRTTAEEKEMSRKALQYWTNFVKTGDPNTAGEGDNWSLPEWPKFTKENEIFKDLTPDMSNRYMKQRECYFIENVLPQLNDALKELANLKTNNDEKSKWTAEGQCLGESCHVETEEP
ncbi:Acetylcholinesterase 1 [Holothuria leucospilota]|uniref:Carboxylic ester hydrolase n=1 Tax=Holothuria leucospilota TaxID=206669 RepID=A0A9Q1BSX6_HOLLE|nr:Acetylcholinesterase 1 [Holothuria leucospilota]